MARTYRKSKTGKKYLDKDRKHQKNSRSCLHHGGCPYCEGNRLYNSRKREKSIAMEVEEFASELHRKLHRGCILPMV